MRERNILLAQSDVSLYSLASDNGCSEWLFDLGALKAACYVGMPHIP